MKFTKAYATGGAAMALALSLSACGAGASGGASEIGRAHV